MEWMLLKFFGNESGRVRGWPDKKYPYNSGKTSPYKAILFTVANLSYPLERLPCKAVVLVFHKLKFYGVEQGWQENEMLLCTGQKGKYGLQYGGAD